MRTASPKSAQAGLSLIEVLVSIVIFAFALLGAAGMQISSLRANQFSQSASTATSLARDYGEIMQAFPSSVINTSMGTTSSFFIDTSTLGTVTSASLCTGASAACDPTSFLNASTRDWADKMAKALPGARAKVCRDSEPRDAAGKISWTCDNLGDLVVIKMTWRAKSDKGETFIENDLPRVAIPVLGNQKDYKGT